MYAVVGHAGSIAMGEVVLPGEFSPSFGRGVWPAPCRVRAKKSSGPAAAPAEITRVQLPGSGATPLSYSFSLRTRHSAVGRKGIPPDGWSRTVEAGGRR